MRAAEAPITPALVAEHGLSPEEYDRLCEVLGRAPNLVELGVLSVMWSEHCSYKSSKIHLAKLPTRAPWVVQGPGENAGVVDIGDGQVAVFKMESHNHPSFIEPFQGAATGVGGILRDVFTMGARPIAILDALRFGDPDHPRTRHLVAGVVAGIGGYGNCVGVPTVGGECTFHKSFNGNILVNAMCVGVAAKDKVFYAKAGGIGNPVVYVGAKTGRDGIHGATMASAEFNEGTEAKRPTVQVGDPFTEKLLIEACLELMRGDCIVAIQDMGAAGLTSSSFEMAARGGCGVELDLDAVPLRETGMTPYEIMLSESQERMLMVLAAGREAEAMAVFTKWGLDCAVVGSVTDTGRLVLRHRGAVVADLPVAAVDASSPVHQRPARAAAAVEHDHRRRSGLPLPSPHRPPDPPRQPRSHQQALDLRAVRSPGGRRHDPTAGRRRRRRPCRRARQGVGAGHRLHAALLRRRPVHRCGAGGRRGPPQSDRRGCATARDHQLPQFRQPRAAARHGPARGGHRGHGDGLPGTRLPGSSRATSRSTTRPTASPSSRCRRSAAWG